MAIRRVEIANHRLGAQLQESRSERPHIADMPHQRPTTSTTHTSPPVIVHFSCWRGMPVERWYRTIDNPRRGQKRVDESGCRNSSRFVTLINGNNS
jgi:hypothetical protein